MSVKIGHRLRQARESRGLTLEEMEAHTRIAAHDLAALEAEDFDRIASPYYVRTYLRTYAHVLGLDPREIVEDYRRGAEGLSSSPAGGIGYRDGRPGSRARSRRSRKSRRDRDAVPPAVEESSEEEFSPPSRFSRLPRRHIRSESDEVEEETGTPRGGNTTPRISMPPDLPEPQELGLSPRQGHQRSEGAADSLEGESLSRSGKHAAMGRGGRKNQQSKDDQKDRLGIWYTRFLIAMALLLIPAAIYVFSTMSGDESGSADPVGQDEKSEGDKEETGSADTPKPVLTPLEMGGEKMDRYELAYADQIQLKVKGKDECWLQVREQEIGDALKESLLKKEDVFSYTYKKGNELFLVLAPASGAEVTVNGEQVKTSSYDHKKVIHIALVD
ncbi:MAG: DUF4115 domain-containing protein [Firmicutes bacterium]|nr:DUF4115 domain-containing protein [Bacillota bacterium]